jgi:hypothetical protein
VIGFVLSAPGSDTVYVSGDNASLDVVRQIVERIGPIDVAVLFAGAVQIAQRFDGAYLTLSSDRAAEAAKILGVRLVVPVHFEGWKHFTQDAEALRAAYAGNQVSHLLTVPERGAPPVLTGGGGGGAGRGAVRSRRGRRWSARAAPRRPPRGRGAPPAARWRWHRVWCAARARCAALSS